LHFHGGNNFYLLLEQTMNIIEMVAASGRV
jgi:hypothetical protein